MRDRLIELLNVDMSGNNGDFAEEMADYLIENGVIIPPCKVGDIVYEIRTKQIVEHRVASFRILFYQRFILCFDNMIFNFKSLNNTVFLTKEEAEKALQGGVQE